MSPDEDALLNGIAADPAADLPRLVYADWLEEHGQDLRAEFIRVQCEIAKLEVGPRDVIDRNVHLWRRQQELLDGHMEELLQSVPFALFTGQALGPRFYRGFLDEIGVTMRSIRDYADAIVQIRPTPTRVSLAANEPYYDLERYLAPSMASMVTELSLYRTDADEQDASRNDFDVEFHDLSWDRLKTLTSVNIAVSIPELITILPTYTPTLGPVDDCA